MLVRRGGEGKGGGVSEKETIDRWTELCGLLVLIMQGENTP